jgi:hypothetical protein
MMMVTPFHVATTLVTLAPILPLAMIAAMSAVAVVDMDADATRTHSDPYALSLSHRSH